MIVSKTSVVSIIENEDEAHPSDSSHPTNGEEPDAAAQAASEPSVENSPTPPSPASRRLLDPYEVLQAPRGATEEEIRRAYKARLRTLHPDPLSEGAPDEKSERSFALAARKINHAYPAIVCEVKSSANNADDAA